MFFLTSNQPVWFRASDGVGATGITVPPFFSEGSVGELKCWAVDAVGHNQIKFNHLYGSAVIVDVLEPSAFQFNAFVFAVQKSVATGAPVGDPGHLVLNGLDYDACPSYLLFNFFADGAVVSSEVGTFGVSRNDLTLVPCHQDLRQDRQPSCTKAKFDIWNENEVKYTGAYQCIKCWFEGYLAEIGSYPGGYGGEKFTYRSLHTRAARVRVLPSASTVCTGYPCTQKAIPMLGLLSYDLYFFATGVTTTVGNTATTAGIWNATPAPEVLWDYQDAPPEAPGQ
jgi:hypothetical protein